MQGTHAQPNVVPNAPHENAEDKFHLFTNIHGAEGGLVVPQKVYVATADFIPNAIIKFWQYGRRGVSMEEAFKSSFIRGDEASTGMTNGNDYPVEINSGSDKIIIRLNWPGYQPYDKPIGIKVTRSGDTYTTSVAKLIHGIAKVLKKFCSKDGERLRTRDWKENGNLDWSLDGRISFDQLILHELHHVSQGSWQPVLLVKTDNVVPKDIGVESYASSSSKFEFFEAAAVEENFDA